MCKAQPRMIVYKQSEVESVFNVNSIDSILFDNSRGEMNFFRSTGTTVVHRITDILQGKFILTGLANYLCDSVRLSYPLIRGIETSGISLSLPYTDGTAVIILQAQATRQGDQVYV